MGFCKASLRLGKFLASNPFLGEQNRPEFQGPLKKPMLWGLAAFSSFLKTGDAQKFVPLFPRSPCESFL